MVPEVVQWGYLDEGAQEVLGELENLADPLLARVLAVLVLALEPLEAKLRVLRQVCDVLVGLLEALSSFGDGLGQNVDITSGLILRLGGRKIRSAEKGRG